ncbi:MAG TPA: hypothetical protein VLI39_11500 [Sedimentisphaerales bacterium]|nr:hypothetical protein [Sedimentisphaerales bacterium]
MIETFERNREDYLHGRYSGTQLRREYVDPFFKALGWDVGSPYYAPTDKSQKPRSSGA